MNTVLIIEEDSPRVRLLGWALDQETGYEVVTAPPIDDTEHSVEVRPHFIIFNTHMAVRDKRLWIEALRYLVPDVHVVDLHDPSPDDGHLSSGADAYLTQPYHVAALLDIMAELSGTRSMLAEPGAGVTT